MIWAANLSSIINQIEFIQEDAGNEFALESALKNCDFVFALAGLTGHRPSMDFPKIDLYNNQTIHLCLLEAIRKLNVKPKIIFASTRQVYGRSEHVLIDETHSVNPVDLNGIHKVGAEQTFKIYRRVYNYDTCIIRLPNVYGPRMPLHTPSLGVLGWFINRCYLNKPLQLQVNPQTMRNMAFVGDVVKALEILALSTSHKFDIYNWMGESVSFGQYIDCLKHFFPKLMVEIVPMSEAQKKIDVGQILCSQKRFEDEFGNFPLTPILQGVEKTVLYYKNKLDYYLSR